ncbi:MAG: hypothetical protein QOC63_5122 [Mycobacterium sp.]|jgi:hypothetical protein|nr:hypothetical protein [Mycobacterium sp.]
MTGNTFVGVDYFLQELRRRDADRAEAAVYELGQRAYWLSIINGLRGGSASARRVWRVPRK